MSMFSQYQTMEDIEKYKGTNFYDTIIKFKGWDQNPVYAQTPSYSQDQAMNMFYAQQASLQAQQQQMAQAAQAQAAALANQQAAFEAEQRKRENELARQRAILDWERQKNTLAHEKGLDAAQKVLEEQKQIIENSGKMLTDFERQEKKRFLEAKKGVGQVSEEDFAITDAQRDQAKAFLGKGEDLWKAERDKAYNDTKKLTFESFLSFDEAQETGSLFKKK